MDSQPSEPSGHVLLPPGSPEWVTEELIVQTLATWQPLTDKTLTPGDALVMLINISQLYEAVGLTSAEESDS